MSRVVLRFQLQQAHCGALKHADKLLLRLRLYPDDDSAVNEPSDTI